MQSRWSLVLVVLVSTATAKPSDRPKKKRRAEAPPLEKLSMQQQMCGACEHTALDVHRWVVRAVEEPGLISEWSEYLKKSCVSGRAAQGAVCEEMLARHSRALSAELADLVESADGADDASIALKDLQATLCSNDGVSGLCEPGHFFRRERNSVDLNVRNLASKEAAVYWVPQNGQFDPSAKEQAFINPLGGVMTQNSWKGHTFVFVVDGAFDDALNITLGENRDLGSEAWELKERKGFVRRDLPALVPKKGSVQPATWDEAEDGPWEPPLQPNPALVKNTPYYFQRARGLRAEL